MRTAEGQYYRNVPALFRRLAAAFATTAPSSATAFTFFHIEQDKRDGVAAIAVFHAEEKAVGAGVVVIRGIGLACSGT